MSDMRLGIFCSIIAARDAYANAADEFFNALTEQRTPSEILAAHRRFDLCCRTMHRYAMLCEMDRQIVMQIVNPWSASDRPDVIGQDQR